MQPEQQEQPEGYIAPGLSLSSQPGYGRVLVAAADFDVGVPMLREPPTLLWETPVAANQGDLRMLQEYAKAPVQVKNYVLDFYYPPLDKQSPRVLERKAQAEKLAPLVRLEPKCCQAVLLVADCNAHSSTGPVDETTTDWSANKCAALFDIGAKISHSCLPNTQYGTKNAHGMMEVTSIRKVAAGEQLSLSYLSSLWSTPTWARTATLFASKDFNCLCSRCSAADDTRGVRCSDCRTVCYPQCTKGADWNWDRASWEYNCPKCGGFDSAEFLAIELVQSPPRRHPDA